MRQNIPVSRLGAPVKFVPVDVASWIQGAGGGGSPRIHAGEGALERSVKEYRLGSRASPDFLRSLVAPARFLRLSLTKAAYAVASSAADRKSGFSPGSGKASWVPG